MKIGLLSKRVALATPLLAAALSLSQLTGARAAQTPAAKAAPPATTNASTAAGEAALLVLNKADNTLAIVDPAALKVVARVPVGEGPHEVVASSDG
ncbi:MAG TPA: hypothetical protein VGB61_07685, partial [Pyrinomonadaceae bacterium]